MLPIAIDQFIKDHITQREESLFAADIAAQQTALAEAIDGKSVLVIGGAGTIGSSYIKALLQFRPSRLYVIDTNENGLTELTRDLRSSLGYHIPDDYKTYPIDYGDPVFARILRREGPFDIVANFAAHKHVRSEKDHYAIEAMIENNVLRTRQLLEQLTEHPPEHFFCVSTDKAANPVNVMGASKKIMEEILLYYTDKMPIVTARFANVAFSNGSLLAGFLERIMKRQPLSSPLHLRRYFVSPTESGQLCLLASILGQSGQIFFPKLKEEQMMTFSAIGTQLLEALGYTAKQYPTEEAARQAAAQLTADSQEYPVYYFASDTSGEKMYEEFYTEDESIDWERFQSLGVIQAEPSWTSTQVEEACADFRIFFSHEDANKAGVVELISKLVPTFAHIETGKNLDQKM